MAVTDSRVKDGVLKLGAAPEFDVSCQVVNIRVNSSYDDDGDAQETLCGDLLAAGRKLSGRSLAGTVIQDFTAATATSFTEYVWDHDLEEVPFTYTPNAAAGPTLSGTVRLEVPGETYGGDVNSRVTSDFEWQCTAEVVRTPHAGAAAASSSSSTSTPAA